MYDNVSKTEPWFKKKEKKIIMKEKKFPFIKVKSLIISALLRLILLY